MFGRKKPAAQPAEADDDDADEKPGAAVAEESSVELKAEALAPKKSRSFVAAAVGVVAVTLIAAGGGVGLGMKNAATLARAVRDAQAPAEQAPPAPKISGDTVVRALDPVITNLASPLDTWVRLETAMVFKNGGLANPDVTAAELRQDEVAYLRTVDVSQLEGPSALQHLREDLNERASLRTNGAVSELVIETLIIQ